MNKKTYTILDKICERKRIEVESRKSKISIDKILELAKNVPIKNSFKNALKKNERIPAIIAELKKASPSAGLIRENFDYKNLSQSLENAGANAMSVLTESEFFLGNDEYLKEVSSVVKIPLIRKDFIFDEYQICEAKVLGASAILLIATMLSDEEFKKLYSFAKELNLDVLAEAHDEEEIERLVSCGADIIGVNSRNLKTFETNLETGAKLLSKIPNEIIKVSESALCCYEDLLYVGECGADAVLIGTALMSKENPAQELKKLLGRE